MRRTTPISIGPMTREQGECEYAQAHIPSLRPTGRHLYPFGQAGDRERGACSRAIRRGQFMRTYILRQAKVGNFPLMTQESKANGMDSNPP